MLVVAILFIAFLIVLYFVGKKKQKVMQKLKVLINKTYWNGTIQSFNIQCFMDCISVGSQLRLLIERSTHAKSEETKVALIMLSFLAVLPVLMIAII